MCVVNNNGRLDFIRIYIYIIVEIELSFAAVPS